MTRTTNRGVMPHQHIPEDVPLVSPYVVTPDGRLGTYTSIQAAIDKAVLDGHEDVDNPAVVMIEAGRYTENIFLRRGVYLQGVPGMVGGVVVVGTIVCSLSDSGQGIDKNLAKMAGVSAETPAGGGVGLHFTGTTAQQLAMGQFEAICGPGGQALLSDNTGVDGASRSALICGLMRASGSVGAASPLVQVSAGQVLLIAFVSQLEDQSMVALQSDGIGNMAVESGLVQGGMRLEGISPDPDVLGQLVVTTFPPREALFVGPGGGRLLSGGLSCLGGVSPNVVGTGTLLVGSSCSFLGGTGFDPALTLVHLPAGMPDTIYTPGSPAATAAWAGVPPTQETAIDRMAIQLAVLGGPIP